MNKLVLFAVLLCCVAVNARHYVRNEEEVETEQETLKTSKDTSVRHRRRRWGNNGYDYPHPSYYYPERREYDRSHELLQNIHRLLEDIALYIRRPPPPPPQLQPIYIPYPMSFNYPQLPKEPCSPPKTDDNITTTTTTAAPVSPVKTPNRDGFPGMEDERQIWGTSVSNENEYDDDGDGARPISFDPIAPKEFMKRPSPQVEHGSFQASASTEEPRFEISAQSASPTVQFPGMCNAAILSCCGNTLTKTQQRECFAKIGCSKPNEDVPICTPIAIHIALESFKAAYSPIN